ncbi:response regulator transcription factor [Dehalococcoides mccartyi]|nr:winged helix-turn-helix domain-containing protein [Dehalococcoides mccartyi]
MAKECILLIDDTAVLVTLLKAADYQIIPAANEIDGLKKASQAYADLVIVNQARLKLLLPELAHLINKLDYLPILVLGNRNESAEILELGADSFISSPPSPRELKARINSILRRKRKSPPNKIDGQDSRNKDGNALTFKTQPELTPTENRINTCLKLNQGQLMEYQSIIDTVWGKQKVSLDTLHYYMRRLKSKLSGSKIIQQRGAGYWLG